MTEPPISVQPCDRPQTGHPGAAPKSPACGACCTQLTDLCVTIAGQPVLEHINLHLHCGELVTLIGPNGAGKTTLLRVLLGEVAYTGSFSFLAIRAGAESHRPRIGYVPQQLNIDRQAPITVLDVFATALSRRPVWLGSARHIRDEARAQLAQVDAAQLVDERLGTLSGGQLQRVMLAFALTPVPDILLLDEPLASVDSAGTALFYECVSRLRRAHDLAIIMVSHNLIDAARVSDRIVILNRRILLEGPPADIVTTGDVRAMFGLPATIFGGTAC